MWEYGEVSMLSMHEAMTESVADWYHFVGVKCSFPSRWNLGCLLWYQVPAANKPTGTIRL